MNGKQRVFDDKAAQDLVERQEQQRVLVSNTKKLGKVCVLYCVRD